MEFVLLDSILEMVLKNIKEDTLNGCVDEFYLPEYKYDRSKIDSLIEKGYVKKVKDSSCGKETYSLTYNAKRYDKLKQDFLDQKQKDKKEEKRKFQITTAVSIVSSIISLGALIVSIIALCG